MKTRWKFLKLEGKTIVSNHGDMRWKIGVLQSRINHIVKLSETTNL